VRAIVRPPRFRSRTSEHRFVPSDLHEIPAGSFDHAGRDRQAVGERTVIVAASSVPLPDSKTTAALELRATWSLSPDLVLTLYAQPFVSVGRYNGRDELAAAGSRDVRWYETLARPRPRRSSRRRSSAV